MRTGKKRTIRLRFLRSILLCIAVPLLLLCGLLLYETAYIRRQNSQLVRNEIENNLTNDIEHYFGLLDNAAYNIYRYYYLLQDLQEDGHVDSLYPRDYLSNIYNIYDSHFTAINSVQSIFLFNRRQEYLSGFMANWPATFYHRVSDMYLAGLARLHPPGSEVTRQILVAGEDELYRGPMLKYYYPILFKREYVGFLEFNINPGEFHSLLEAHNLFHEGELYLIAGDKVIYHTGGGRLGESFPALDLRGANHVTHEIKDYGITVEYLYEDDLSILTITQFTLLALVVSLAVAAVISFYASRRITQPIVMLDSQMQEIKQGNYNAHVDITTGDEIAELGRTFNEMSDMLTHYIHYEVESKLAYNNEQIRTLQAQISPHFLHNTLQAISTMAAADGNNDIIAMCKALSNMYRFNMNIDQKLVPVAEEIMHVRNYMLIIGKRYPGFLHFRVQLPPELRDLLIPKLILQPAVENAIEHGIPSREGGAGGELTISFFIDAQADVLCVQVADNGAGLCAEELSRINASLRLPLEYKDGESRHSIGLHNVHTRIRLLCGEGFGIRLLPGERGGVITDYTLPVYRRKGGRDEAVDR